TAWAGPGSFSPRFGPTRKAGSAISWKYLIGAAAWTATSRSWWSSWPSPSPSTSFGDWAAASCFLIGIWPDHERTAITPRGERSGANAGARGDRRFRRRFAGRAGAFRQGHQVFWRRA